MNRFVGLAIAIATVVTAVPAEAQDAANGENVFRRCRACHAVGATARNKSGPHLNGVFGRRAASVPGFNYSDAMKEKGAAGLVWNDQTLAAYLSDPDAFVPNGVMAMAVRDPTQLRDVIAYLKTQR
jgi:cytochrome c2